MTCKGGDLIVFDGACIFCSTFVRFVARHDRHRQFRFVTAQSPTGRSLYRQHGLDPDRMDTSIVIVDGVAYTRMQGLCVALRELGGPWRVFAVLRWGPTPVSDWIYTRMARNRRVFGQRRCPLPSAELRGRLIE